MKGLWKYFFVLTLILSTSCNDNIKVHDVTGNNWLFTEGYYLRDVLDFNNGYFRIDSQLKIYARGKYVGRVIKCNNNLVIIDTLNNNKGYYEKL